MSNQLAPWSLTRRAILQRAIGLAAAAGVPSLAMAKAARVDVYGLRTWPAPDHTRLVFDLSGPIRYHLFQPQDKEGRLIVEMERSIPVLELDATGIKDKRLAAISSQRLEKSSSLWLQLKLRNSITPIIKLLEPYGDYGYRLVIDLYDKTPELAKKTIAKPEKPSIPIVKSKKQKPEKSNLRRLIIAIDAGHGGEDPGAIGGRKTKEKDIVLSIAKKLAAKVKKQRGMQPLLIRDGDYYVSLGKRVRKARSRKADAFVSIHADAFRNSRAKGASTFILSNRASSKAASWLAKQQNASDLIGGVSVDERNDEVGSVLLDMAQTGNKKASYTLARSILKQLGKLGDLHGKGVHSARFAVLKAPDIPSVLVETGFITNRGEEKKLRTAKYRAKLADAILTGVEEMFVAHPVPGTWLAESKKGNSRSKVRRSKSSKGKTKKIYVVRPGDSLVAIARKYKVSLSKLRKVNKITGSVLHVGQKLLIP